MLANQSFRSYAYAGSPSGPGVGQRFIHAQHSPRQNHLLAALPSDCYKRLLPKFEDGPLPLGSTVYGAGEQQKFLYFLTDGIACRLHRLANGSSADFGVTGREGVIGIASYLGGENMPNDALMVSAGYAYRLPASFLKEEFEHCAPLRQVLLRYTQALSTQIAQIALCKRHHTLQQHLCRWILSCLDRLPSNELAMSHEQIAEMLGVRREGVTSAAGRLQNAGLIRYSRGHIAVINRSEIEAQVCECYSVVKHEYERLLPLNKEQGQCGGTKQGARVPLQANLGDSVAAARFT
jgi:CRP-like cAMP-binding protein